MEKIKILMASGGTLINRGVEQYLTNLIGNIDHDIFSIDVLANRCDNPSFKNLVEQYCGRVIELECSDMKIIHNFLFAAKFSSFLKLHSYDVAEIQTGVIEILGLGVSAAKGKVSAVIAHTHSSHKNTLVHKFKRALFGPLMRGADRFLACSRRAGEDSFPEAVQGRLEVMPNAIEVEKFQFDYKAREKVRENLKLDGKFVIGHVGAFTESKNHKFLIDILEELAKGEANQGNGRECVLLLVGAGELEESIKELAAQRGLSSRIIFYGISDDVPSLLSAMDMFVFPSLWEGLGIAVIEAQANGLPCICSLEVPEDVMVTPEVKRIGLEDTAAWIMEINEIKNNRQSTDKRLEANLLVAESRYNMETCIKSIEDIYVTALRHNGR